MRLQLTTLATLSLATTAFGQLAITYIDANTTNTTLLDGSAFTPETTATTTADNLWFTRVFANEGSIFESNNLQGSEEDAPALALTLTDLTPGETYILYTYFWSNEVDDWRIRTTTDLANIIDGAIIEDTAFSYSKNGNIGQQIQIAPAVPANSPDTVNTLGVSIDSEGSNTANDFFSSSVLLFEGSNRRLYQAYAGTAVADSSGEVKIYVDDFGSSEGSAGNFQRTWFDGVGFIGGDLSGDSDNDGISDFVELTSNMNPNSDIGINGPAGDKDLDGISNIEEALGIDGIANTGDETLLNNTDSDNDGVSDGTEIFLGSSAVDPSSLPSTPAFDFTLLENGATQPGWTAALNGNATDSNGVTVASSALGADIPGLAPRDRVTDPAGILLNTDALGADIANAAMWRDFIFAQDSSIDNLNQGMQIAISSLEPNTKYDVIVFGYDEFSTGERTARWRVQGSSDTENSITFSGGNDPTSLNDYSATIRILTDDLGNATIEGVSSVLSSTSPNIFVNGLVIFDVADDPIVIRNITFNSTGNVTLTWESDLDQLYSIEASTDLSIDSFSTILENISGLEGMTTQPVSEALPEGTTQRFYRVREQTPPAP